MSDSKMLLVKPIVHYPRVAEVGKTYLMTIDLQVEEGFEWQYEEEEYPIYCSVSSNLFGSRPTEEPVIVLHRFGNTYGPTKFLLTAIAAEEGEIEVTLANRWGVLVKVLHLVSQVKLGSWKSETESMVDSLRSQMIRAIIEKRRPLNVTLRKIRENLSLLSSELQGIEVHYDYLTRHFQSLKLKNLSLSTLQDNILYEIEELKKLGSRFSRDTLNIGIVGRARQGKSRLIQSLTGLSTDEIPDGDRQHCTGVRSTVYHQLDTEVYAEVWFHSERSFLDEVIAPYYQELQLGSPPKTLDSFAGHPLPPLPSSMKLYAEPKAKYEYLHRYRSKISEYRHLLDRVSPLRIRKELIREFVAQDNTSGERIYFNYLAVKDVKIFCPFPQEDVGQIALVDMPGLGDTGIGYEERLLKILGEDVDIILFVRMPKSTGDSWFDVDVRLYDIAGTSTLLPLSLWSFMILNRTQDFSKNGENLRNCEDFANTINEVHMEVIQCIIADCSNSEEALQRILDQILNYLVSNVDVIDGRLVSNYINKLHQLQIKINLELSNLRKAVENRPPEFSLFEKLFNSFWRKFKLSFDNFLQNFEQEYCEKYINIYEQELEKEIAGLKADLDISLNELVHESFNTGSAWNLSRNLSTQVRIQLSRKFSKLDDVLARLVEQMKNDVVSILIAHEELSGLSDKRGVAFLEKLRNWVRLFSCNVLQRS